MNQIIEKAYAKINLGLQITGKRPDGYHLLSMVMQTVSLYDKVGIYRTNDSDEISMDMDFGGRHPEEEITCDGDNLCVKAAKLICGKLPESHGYYMHLVKNIPSAAGMAGGSSDAGAVLRGINRIEGNYFSKEELLSMALELGADVPYCIDGGKQTSMPCSFWQSRPRESRRRWPTGITMIIRIRSTVISQVL